MSNQFSTPPGMTSRERTGLVVTVTLFASAVLLAALGRTVEEILLLIGGVASASVVTVTAFSLAGAARSGREAQREALLALARLAGQG
ncbi:hypothetical protein [Streptomyces sp. bgisy091]|uniref:hypothetical protein n=1 Tax=Streptomyces sp. bgisy091 TaxID=3413778 RepID=UPI003D714277